MTDVALPTVDDTAPQPPPSRLRRVKLALKIVAGLFVLALAWLLLTAPLSRSLQPANAPGLTILASDGEPIARWGAVMGEPVDVTELPPYVGQAFVAIEDRRFFRHIGIDPWGVARAVGRNLLRGRLREGGSTISQQLAKTSFLTQDRTFGRKAQEALITLWLEARLSKEEILSRYLSNVYFGDNVYGLRAAARHYFNVAPQDLTLAQAAMLAGVVNNPSRLAPTGHLEAARRRARLVLNEMVESGFITQAQMNASRPARVRQGDDSEDVPTGSYFADWVAPRTGGLAEGSYGERQVVTTLDGDLQRLAARTVRRAGLGRAQAALVAMRLDGRVVAMVGGRDYRESAFNRATQARRQPGSAFKLFVYLAAFRAGLNPNSMANDAPIRLGDWQPRNYGNSYRGPISLRDAFAYSSNSVAVQLQERIGRDAVIRAARDLGVTAPLRPDPSLALGTNGVSLVELTAAYAAVAAGRYPIVARGLPEPPAGWFGGSLANRLSRDRAFPMLRDVLYAAANRGTGRAAALSVPTFGKTGTTSDYRDAVFVGFAGDLVVGVWVGNDDNSPLPGTSGGGTPARIWRTFMTEALGLRPVRRPPPQPLSQTDSGDETANQAAPAIVIPPLVPGAPSPDQPPAAPQTGTPPPQPAREEPPRVAEPSPAR
jgi:penicillin-binding protein 1A